MESKKLMPSCITTIKHLEMGHKRWHLVWHLHMYSSNRFWTSLYSRVGQYFLIKLLQCNIMHAFSLCNIIIWVIFIAFSNTYYLSSHLCQSWTPYFGKQVWTMPSLIPLMVELTFCILESKYITILLLRSAYAVTYDMSWHKSLWHVTQKFLCHSSLISLDSNMCTVQTWHMGKNDHY